MRARHCRTAATVGAIALGLLVSGCSSDSLVPVAPTPSVSAMETPTEPAPTVEPVAVEAPAPVAGDAVPADAVEELRAEGVSVYVSPNSGGEGLVVEPGVALPEIVVNDIQANSTPTAPADKSAFSAQATKEAALRLEMEKAGLSALFLTHAGEYGADGSLTGSQYVVRAFNVANARDFTAAAGDTRSTTRDGAIAAAQGLIDSNPGIQMVDLTS
ncbi:hypothetical protein [Sanguibacter sp. Leaf3]|uniref:hypothetical protein n=1 Tax=Sanguibacter sp. Leaf3 TaxID=1736209 RepID=UPI0012E3F43A|nr:hypothetical protein [Sanguibacter sp. Leaf3]